LNVSFQEKICKGKIMQIWEWTEEDEQIALHFSTGNKRHQAGMLVADSKPSEDKLRTLHH